MSPLVVFVIPPVTAVEDNMPTDVVITVASDVIACSFVLIDTGPVLRVLLTPVVLMELMEPVEFVDVIWVVVMSVGVWEVISSEEFSEESLESLFINHNHFCSKYLQSLLGPPRRWPLLHWEWNMNQLISDTHLYNLLIFTVFHRCGLSYKLFPTLNSANYKNPTEMSKK